MKNGFVGALVASMLVACAAGASAAERTMIVLDASGSMWGQIDGTPKLQIARDTLREVLQSVPAELELGLLAYGHRERGNCADIEIVVEPAPGTAGAIIEAADRMRFLGRTPLSEAVRRAAEAMRHTEEKATVILITDGIETCNADPCALGIELEQSGVDFTAHVVGFGLSRDEGRQVACLAENTGGRYIQASDADALREALTDTIAPAPAGEDAAAAPQPVEAPPATVSTNDTPSIGQAFLVEWTGPGGVNDYIDIVAPGTEEITGSLSYVWIGEAPVLPIRAPGEPGTYELRYVWDGPEGRRVLARASVEVADAENALFAPDTVSVGQTFEVGWRGPGLNSDYIDIVVPERTETSGELSYSWTSSGNPLTIRAPGTEGEYRLRYVLEAPEGRRVLTSVPLTVIPAESTLAFPPSVTAGAVFAVHWTGPGNGQDYVDLVPAGHTEPNGELAYRYLGGWEQAEAIELRAPGDAGRYLVRYILEAPDGRKILVSEPLEVTPAIMALTAPDEVEAGQAFEVEWEGPGVSPDYVDIVATGHTEPNGELSYFWATSETGGGSGALTAPDAPGAYVVRYILDGSGGRKVAASRPITVR